MIPTGEPYQPEGPISVRSVSTTLILGTVVAILSALAVWLWEISPIPTLVLLTAAIHGCLIGAAMTFMVGRLRMRNPRLIGVIGFVCGILSAGLVHYGHYVNFVREVNAEFRTRINADSSLAPKEKQAELEALEKEPSRAADQFLEGKTGHGGVIGSLLLRNENGVTIKNATVSGIPLWILWGAEGLFVAFMAMAMPMARASEPFCEDCGYWCTEVTSPLVFAGSAGDILAGGIRADSASKVAEAYKNPPRPTPNAKWPGTGAFGGFKPASSCVSPIPITVSMNRCPTCELVFANLSVMVPNGKQKRKVFMLKAVRISPDTAHALEFAPSTTRRDAEEIPPEEIVLMDDGEANPNSS